MKEKDNVMELVDPRLKSKFITREAMVMINVALLCTNVIPSLRPTMSSVVSMLEDRTVKEVVSDASEVSDEMKMQAIQQFYKQIEKNETLETQGQSISVNRPWTDSSTSFTDLYPVHMDSSYLGKRN